MHYYAMFEVMLCYDRMYIILYFPRTWLQSRHLGILLRTPLQPVEHLFPPRNNHLKRILHNRILEIPTPCNGLCLAHIDLPIRQHPLIHMNPHNPPNNNIHSPHGRIRR